MSERWYRYDGVAHDGTASIYLTDYLVLRHTPKGVWLGVGYSDEKWVSKHSRKRFAYPTKDQAWESFVIRTARRVAHCERHLYCAKAILNKIEYANRGDVERLIVIQAGIDENYCTRLNHVSQNRQSS